MSSSPLPPPAAPPAPTSAPAPAAPASTLHRREITLISHSMLFYWWPIWLLGFAFAFWTWSENHRLVIVPPNPEVARSEAGGKTHYDIAFDGSRETEFLRRANAVLVTPEGRNPFPTRVSQHAWMGPLFCVVLLLTVVITNVQLRGLWSFLVLMMLLVIALIITLIPEGWDRLLSAFGHLHIYINMAGYLFIGTIVFILWAVSVFIFDKRTYIKITPGNITVCEHIGASLRSFDTMGMSFEKQRDDMFRHWLLGFFSGDLIVRVSGAEKETIRLPNVLWIGWRLDEVQELLREKATVHA
jgi:hypothetical protein